MKGTSKVIMGATLVMVVCLAMVLGLVLVLLAELYCSLLLRRRRLRANAKTATATATDLTAAESAAPSLQPHQQDQSSDSSHPPTTPLSSFYAQGVLQAPRSLLFPAITFKEDCIEAKKRLSRLHHRVIDIPKVVEPIASTNSSPTISLASTIPSPPISIAASPPQPAQKEKMDGGDIVTTTTSTTSNCNDKANVDHFVYICNPIYENTETRLSGPNTPFETPDTSPSRLETVGSGSSGEDDEAGIAKPSPPSSPSSPLTPPLTPMKKLPAEACSVSLRDARSLATSGSDSNSNNGLSSSSSGSPCTSPSW